MAGAENGKIIPIRLSPDDVARLEEAAARAGYRHLSTYIRDSALNVGESRALNDIREEQAEQAAQLALLGQKIDAILFLLLQRASAADKALLRENMENQDSLDDLIGHWHAKIRS